MSKRKKNAIVSCFAVFLALSIAMVVYALIIAKIDIPDKLTMGTIEIEWNIDLKKESLCVATEMEPGRTVVESFGVKNVGTESFYCDIYLDNITGDVDLAKAAEVKVFDSDNTLLLSTNLNDFTSENKLLGTAIVAPASGTTFTLHIILPEESGNSLQSKNVDFDIVVEATQSKNNPRT